MKEDGTKKSKFPLFGKGRGDTGLTPMEMASFFLLPTVVAVWLLLFPLVNVLVDNTEAIRINAGKIRSLSSDANEMGADKAPLLADAANAILTDMEEMGQKFEEFVWRFKVVFIAGMLLFSASVEVIKRRTLRKYPELREKR